MKVNHRGGASIVFDNLLKMYTYILQPRMFLSHSEISLWMEEHKSVSFRLPEDATGSIDDFFSSTF